MCVKPQLIYLHPTMSSSSQFYCGDISLDPNPSPLTFLTHPTSAQVVLSNIINSVRVYRLPDSRQISRLGLNLGT